jgi:hypothetical protein
VEPWECAERGGGRPGGSPRLRAWWWGGERWGEAEVVGGAESGRETGRRTPPNCRARARVTQTQVGQPTELGEGAGGGARRIGPH